MNDSKPWYLSKTVWLNAAVFAVAVIELLSQQPFIPQSWLPMLGSAVAVANLYLRTTTDTKLTK